MNKFNFNKLTPFKWFVIENFPFIEADFDTLTEWQLFCKLGKEINKIHFLNSSFLIIIGSLFLLNIISLLSYKIIFK